MEVIRKYGLWIISAVIIALALVFAFLVVGKIASELASGVAELEKRRDELQDHASKPDSIPGVNWVDVAEAMAEADVGQLDDCAKYLANQPRKGHTRRFFENERPGFVGREIEGNWAWTTAYEKHNRELGEQLSRAGLGAFHVISLAATWAGKVPTDEQITAAQIMYWFQKDLADALTDQVAKDFASFLSPPPDQPDAWPRTPADLVVNRSLPEKRPLDELLRIAPKGDLLAVLEAILINDNHLNLATIFDRCLPDFAEDDKSPWQMVLSLTMDDEQRKYLDQLVPAGQEDLANRQRFVTFVMDLRSVRYRADVIELLENHGQKDVADSIRNLSDQERLRLLDDIQGWSRTRIAETIAAVVSINDEKEYHLVRYNHSPQFADISTMKITQPGDLRVAKSAGALEFYRTFPFSMRVELEFERIPVFFHRLLTNSWHYRFVVEKVAPKSKAVRGGSRRPTHGGLAEPVEARTMDVRNYVWLDVEGEGYQFAPLRAETKTIEKPADE